jgi:hypothetical protein
MGEQPKTQQRAITRELLDQAHPDAISGLSGISILTLARDNSVCLTFVNGVAEVLAPDQFDISPEILARKNDRELLSYLMLKGLSDEEVVEQMKVIRGHNAS